jgi:hypothetical protein
MHSSKSQRNASSTVACAGSSATAFLSVISARPMSPLACNMREASSAARRRITCHNNI